MSDKKLYIPFVISWNPEHETEEGAEHDLYRIFEEAEQAGLFERTTIEVTYGQPAAVTKTGRILSGEEIEALADEAERGYDVSATADNTDSVKSTEGGATATCKHCGRTITRENPERWVDTNATGDDAMWRETCDSHETFEAEHEPAEQYTAEDIRARLHRQRYSPAEIETVVEDIAADPPA